MYEQVTKAFVKSFSQLLALVTFQFCLANKKLAFDFE